jgi:hypothetical protein
LANRCRASRAAVVWFAGGMLVMLPLVSLVNWRTLIEFYDFTFDNRCGRSYNNPCTKPHHYEKVEEMSGA